jgi:hypothetical protein
MNDNAFDALAHERRRALLLDVLDENRVGPLGGESAPTDAEQRVQIAMYHRHLPKLEDYGYIEWNRDAHEVVEGKQFEEIRPLLEWLDEHGDVADRNGLLKP